MSEETKTVQCAHCAKSIEIAIKEIRVMNYCWSCK
jgi:copper chaperone CopZ